MGNVRWATARTLVPLLLLIAVAGCTSAPPTATPPAAPGPAAAATAIPAGAPPPTGAGGPAAATATPSPTVLAPTSTATVAATASGPLATAACPVEQSVCTFAAQLNQLVAGGAFEPIVLRSVATAWDCPGPAPRGAGDAFPLCEGSTAGERRMGYSLARLRSEGAVMSGEQYREFLRTHVSAADASKSDAHGPGNFRLVSIGCPQRQTVSCAQQFVVGFSSILKREPTALGTPVRSLLLFFVEQDGGAGPQVKMVVDGGLLPEDPHQVVVQGGTAETLSPLGMGPFGVFHKWTPNP